MPGSGRRPIRGRRRPTRPRLEAGRSAATPGRATTRARPATHLPSIGSGRSGPVLQPVLLPRPEPGLPGSRERAWTQAAAAQPGAVEPVRGIAAGWAGQWAGPRGVAPTVAAVALEATAAAVAAAVALAATAVAMGRGSASRLATGTVGPAVGRRP